MGWAESSQTLGPHNNKVQPEANHIACLFIARLMIAFVQQQNLLLTTFYVLMPFRFALVCVTLAYISILCWSQNNSIP